jgi:hypothetical protein
MKRLYILVILLQVLGLSTYSQITLKGVLTDKESNKPIEYATIYINGTTNGVISNEKGEYTLTNIVLPAEIIFSHVSYEPHSIKLIDKNKNIINVSLVAKNVKIEEVVVKDRNKRAKNMKLFLENFLGNDEWGKAAKLLNPNALRFEWEYKEKKIYTQNVNIGGNSKIRMSKDGSSYVIDKPYKLNVYATEPLKVELPLLGYDIQYDLVKFCIEYTGKWNSYSCNILGYSYFKPMEPKTTGQQKRFEKRRDLAFFNSSQHFFRSLYSKKLLENGYRIFEVKKDSSSMPEYPVEISIERMLKYKTNSAYIKGLKDRDIRIFYYGDRKGRPINQKERKGRHPVQTQVYFLSDRCVIRSNGTTPENTIVFAPYIGSKKIGALLPDNYTPMVYK